MSRNANFDAASGARIEYRYAGIRETGGATKHHVVEAVHPQLGVVGSLDWTAKHVHDLKVDLGQRRQGIATGLWRHAHSVANGRSIPAPKHSSDRTNDGDAWARTVGGSLPRRNRA